MSSKSSREIIPKRYITFALGKTFFQVAIAFVSMWFITESGFFIPGNYDATVWTKDSIGKIYLPQGIFELCDLFAELWMLTKGNGKQHLPWDSIAHHSASAGYAFYIWYYCLELDHGFLGLAVAALSCQIIGPLYTLNRLRLRFRFLGLCLIGVQLLYRCPLAFVSVLRAIQYFWVAPPIHFLLCCVLAHLDYKWTRWSFKMHHRLQEQHHKNKEFQKNEKLKSL